MYTWIGPNLDFGYIRFASNYNQTYIYIAVCEFRAQNLMHYHVHAFIIITS